MMRGSADVEAGWKYESLERSSYGLCRVDRMGKARMVVVVVVDVVVFTRRSKACFRYSIVTVASAGLRLRLERITSHASRLSQRIVSRRRKQLRGFGEFSPYERGKGEHNPPAACLMLAAVTRFSWKLDSR